METDKERNCSKTALSPRETYKCGRMTEPKDQRLLSTRSKDCSVAMETFHRQRRLLECHHTLRRWKHAQTEIARFYAPLRAARKSRLGSIDFMSGVMRYF